MTHPIAHFIYFKSDIQFVLFYCFYSCTYFNNLISIPQTNSFGLLEIKSGAGSVIN